TKISSAVYFTRHATERAGFLLMVAIKPEQNFVKKSTACSSQARQVVIAGCGKSGILPVFVRQEYFDVLGNQPVDADFRIVPEYSALVGGIVKIVAFIKEFGFIRKHEET